MARKKKEEEVEAVEPINEEVVEAPVEEAPAAEVVAEEPIVEPAPEEVIEAPVEEPVLEVTEEVIEEAPAPVKKATDGYCTCDVNHGIKFVLNRFGKHKMCVKCDQRKH